MLSWAQGSKLFRLLLDFVQRLLPTFLLHAQVARELLSLKPPNLLFGTLTGIHHQSNRNGRHIKSVIKR
eukprot:3154448-Amphidinium_carterae.1